MERLTLYAKRVNTDDRQLRQSSNVKYWIDNPYYMDVQITNDKGEVVGVYPWYYKSKPTKRNKYLNLDSYRYNLKWLE